MANAELGMLIDAPADKVWQIIAGPKLEELITSLYADKTEFEGSGEGAILTTTLKTGGTVRERIESIDNEERSLKYRVIDNGPWPYTNYHGEMRVTPSGRDACSVSFQCSFVPVGMEEEQSRRFWLEHNKAVINKLEQFAKA